MQLSYEEFRRRKLTLLRYEQLANKRKKIKPYRRNSAAKLLLNTTGKVAEMTQIYNRNIRRIALY